MNNLQNATHPTLKSLLFGGFVMPDIPGRIHTADDVPSKQQLSAINRKARVIKSPKRQAIKNSLSCVEWLSVVQISKATGSTTHYVQKEVLALLRESALERRQINKAKNQRWYEYRLVSKPCK